jgi:DNA repair exonuclease SbcCD ATPase subunit
MTINRDRMAASKILREIEEQAEQSADLFTLREQYNRLKADYVKLRTREKEKRDLLNHLIDVLGEAIRTGVITRGDYFGED